jgi:hypothetical protein
MRVPSDAAKTLRTLVGALADDRVRDLLVELLLKNLPLLRSAADYRRQQHRPPSARTSSASARRPAATPRRNAPHAQLLKLPKLLSQSLFNTNRVSRRRQAPRTPEQKQR